MTYYVNPCHYIASTHLILPALESEWTIGDGNHTEASPDSQLQCPSGIQWRCSIGFRWNVQLVPDMSEWWIPGRVGVNSAGTVSNVASVRDALYIVIQYLYE